MEAFLTCIHVPCKDVPVSVDCGTPIGAQPEDDEPLQPGTDFDARFLDSLLCLTLL